MRQLSQLELNYPGSIFVKGVGHIRCPKIGEVVELRNKSDGSQDGEALYNLFLDILLRTKAQFLESIGKELEEAQLKELDQIPLFYLYLMFEDTRKLLMASIEFFMDESIAFDKTNMTLVTYKNVAHPDADDIDMVGEINVDNFVDVKNLILKRNYIQPPKNPDGKRRSKRMMEFDAKIEKGRKQSKKFKANQRAMQLGNLVSKVAAYSSTGMQEVYNLTVYQLYDQFFEINNSVQIDAALTRWCVWGKDKFDFSQWYAITNEKQ